MGREGVDSGGEQPDKSVSDVSESAGLRVGGLAESPVLSDQEAVPDSEQQSRPIVHRPFPFARYHMHSFADTLHQTLHSFAEHHPPTLDSAPRLPFLPSSRPLPADQRHSPQPAALSLLLRCRLVMRDARSNTQPNIQSYSREEFITQTRA